MDADPAIIAELAGRLAGCERVLFITGAGISADSGLPTYRGIGGLYNDAATEDDYPIEVALSGEMMRRRPEICWKYIAQIEAACRGAQANAAHAAIARIESLLPEVWTLTQNIDGFHRQAGSHKLIEIHGRLQILHCTVCEHSEERGDLAGLTIPPACPDCGALIRPAVVLFNEMLPEPAVEELHRVLADGPQAVISIGTTSVFPYIAGPVFQARQTGGLTVEINPGDSEVSAFVDRRIRARAIDVLPALADAVAAERAS